jgi:glyoxylase-like metal-dependent hydrolase (beta-lactamase superfamily II)
MYEIYALKVGEKEVDSSHMFYGVGDGNKSVLCFYFICLKEKSKVILLDTGISLDEVIGMKLDGAASREELLGRIDVHPKDVEAIILTHLHFDHFSKPEFFPNCLFYVQRKEFQYWNEDVPRFRTVLYRPQTDKPRVDLETLQKLNIQKRLRFLDGDTEVYPGIHTSLCGAHTPGSQFVVVQTSRGSVLCCSDFVYAYRNLEESIPIGTFTNLVEWITGIQKIENMHLPREFLIPGHDPKVMTIFPKVADGVVRIA